jgi:tetratricopeptide (TPR) repeat protein
MEFRFCPTCGTPTDTGARFCAACGLGFKGAGSVQGVGLIGLVTLSVLLMTGGGFWFWFRLSPPIERPLKPGEGVARSGGTSAAPATGSAPGSGSPGGKEAAGSAGHPPMELPADIKNYIANLAKETAAKPKDVAAWQTLARVQYRASRLDPSYADDARRTYDHILELDANDLEAIRGLGNLAYDRQEHEVAVQFYQRYLKVKPADSEVRTDLGTMLFSSNKPDEAIGEYKKVLDGDPKFFQAYFNLGIVYDSKGDLAAARESLEKARELAPDENVKGRIAAVLKQQATAGGTIAEAASTVDRAESAAAAAKAGAPGSAGPTNPPGESSAPAGGNSAGMAGGGMPGMGGAPPSVSMGDAKSFPEAVEALFRSHSIAGPRVQKVEWKSATAATVTFSGFPMNSMPEPMRNKYLERMTTAVGEAQKKFTVSGEVKIELLDSASGEVMATVKP